MNPHLKQLLRTPKACLWFAGALAAVWLETVVAQPVLVNSYLPNAVYGQAYAANLMVGGTPAPTSVTVTGLPSGLTAVHNGSGSIAITGKATQAGVFSVQITATNSGGTISPTVPLSVPRYGVVSAVAWNGNTRGCAVVDGGVQCFGEGFADATGTSIATESQPKQLIAAGSGATAIAGSPDDFQYLYPGAHYCAVVNGGVRCWGNNDFGQLGNNSTTDSALPVQTMPAGSNVVAVAVGSYLNEFRQRVAAYACAIVDGGVQCWGRYQTGATGSRLTPTWVVPQNSGATALSANYGHTCAVVGGGVRCWGVHNDYGALGGGLVFPPGSGATAVATGLGHSCAALGGGVQCWGNNAWGQLGAATQYDFSYTPLQAIPPGAGVTSLTGGQLHTCSLINAAHFCWGTAGPYIGYQAIGFGIHRYRVFTETNNLSLIDRIPGSIIDGLAVTRTFDSATPTRGLVPVQALPAGSGVQTLAAASAHTCALASGGVLCWGPSDRRLGALDELSLIRGYGLAEAIGVAGGATSISAWGAETCAVANGGVLCWADGYAPGYILGAGSGATAASFWTRAGYLQGEATCYVIDGGVSCVERTFNYPVYTDVLEQKIPAQSGVTAIASSDGSGCAIAFGGVRCWGRNNLGQLGDGTTDDRVAPVQTIAAASGATAITAGYAHFCAVVGGGVKCWGLNNSGQLGTGSTATTQLTPVQAIAPGSGVTAISAVYYHTCAVVAGGVRCWGRNGNGQLGNNTLVDSSIPVQVVASGAGATAVAAGLLHSCAAVNSGVQCWGDNERMQIADPSTVPSRKRYLQLPSTPRSRILDVDQNQPLAEYRALTDGQIILRYMMGLTGVALTQGALSPNSTRVDPTLVKAYLDFIRAHLDIDGNGTIDAETDGALLLRYLLGFRGQPLLDGAIATRGLPIRATPQAIEAYLASLMLQ